MSDCSEKEKEPEHPFLQWIDKANKGKAGVTMSGAWNDGIEWLRARVCEEYPNNLYDIDRFAKEGTYEDE